MVVSTVSSSLFHTGECDIVIGVTFNHKGSLPGWHLTGLTEVISEQITMFVSPVKQTSLTVAPP